MENIIQQLSITEILLEPDFSYLKSYVIYPFTMRVAEVTDLGVTKFPELGGEV